MIDQDKTRALLTELRYWESEPCLPGPAKTCKDAADAIELLLAEVEAANRELELSKLRVMGSNAAVDSITKLVDKLRAELEAAAADKRDAERYRWLRDEGDVGVRDIFGRLSPYLNAGLDTAIDAALAQRQGEGS